MVIPVPQAPADLWGLWRGGVVKGLSDCCVGGPVGVRPAGASAVEETPLDVSRLRVCAEVVR